MLESSVLLLNWEGELLESSVLLLNWEGKFGAGIQCAFAKLGG